MRWMIISGSVAGTPEPTWSLRLGGSEIEVRSEVGPDETMSASSTRASGADANGWVRSHSRQRATPRTAAPPFGSTRSIRCGVDRPHESHHNVAAWSRVAARAVPVVFVSSMVRLSRPTDAVHRGRASALQVHSGPPRALGRGSGGPLECLEPSSTIRRHGPLRGDSPIDGEQRDLPQVTLTAPEDRSHEARPRSERPVGPGVEQVNHRGHFPLEAQYESLGESVP